jgi:formylglycine-generating enzyme required for sulfatase activity
LCGKTGGGSLPTALLNAPASDDWFHACSHGGDGQHLYPYGNTYMPLVCNTSGLGAGATWPAGSTASCQGGYAGVFDMSGNVMEWSDACDNSTGATDNCMRRGGSFGDPIPPNGSDATCVLAEPAPRDLGGNDGHDIGFRCCAAR